MVKRGDDRNLIILYVFIVLLFLFVVASFYLSRQGDIDSRSYLVGDRICENFLSSAGQDACCNKAHEGDATVNCVGTWKYIVGVQECEYICFGHDIPCPEDARVCDDGSVVVRNSSLECEFNPCPLQ